MTSTARTETVRFVVRDALAGQDLNLISRSSRRWRERWQIVDTADGSVYDELSTKTTAKLTAQDLNAGLYGPRAGTS